MSCLWHMNASIPVGSTLSWSLLVFIKSESGDCCCRPDWQLEYGNCLAWNVTCLCNSFVNLFSWLNLPAYSSSFTDASVPKSCRCRFSCQMSVWRRWGVVRSVWSCHCLRCRGVALVLLQLLNLPASYMSCEEGCQRCTDVVKDKQSNRRLCRFSFHLKVEQYIWKCRHALQLWVSCFHMCRSRLLLSQDISFPHFPLKILLNLSESQSR